MIVRSNGTVTYVGKDIAYQLWKFGLLGKDFHYRPWMRYPSGHELWVTTDQPAGDAAPAFGRGARVYNVIDSRQSYLQDVVAAGLRALGYNEQAERSIHFSYEMVALTPRTCAELGIELSEEDRKRHLRRGVRAQGTGRQGRRPDRQADREGARGGRLAPSPKRPEEERQQVAEQIAVGALRYFMLKFTRNAVIAFDMQEALSFEGETGPVRAVRRRARPQHPAQARRERRKPPGFRPRAGRRGHGPAACVGGFLAIVLAVSKADSALDAAIASGEPSHVARYAFQLAQAFNSFYHEYPVLQEADRERRMFLLWLTDYFRRQLERTLGILGIEVPNYM